MSNFVARDAHWNVRNGRARPSSLALTMPKLPQDFADLLAELCEAKVEFLVVGGWAVVLYGHVRATDDLDIFVRASEKNSAPKSAASRSMRPSKGQTASSSTAMQFRT